MIVIVSSGLVGKQYLPCMIVMYVILKLFFCIYDGIILNMGETLCYGYNEMCDLISIVPSFQPVNSTRGLQWPGLLMSHACW